MESPTTHILIVEDRDALRRLMQRALEGEGYRVSAAADVAATRRCLGPDIDLVFSDLKLPDGSGLDVLNLCKEHVPKAPVVVMTAFGTITTAVEAMKLGAVDFLEKPVELDDLFELARSLSGDNSRQDVFQPEGAPPIVGRHPRLATALKLLQKVATTESTVLLTGESGTGKGLFAQCLHALSPRRQQPFVAVNCAAIPETLMENELFGHEKGAFTGATRRQAGRFELARGGTIFLDEIGELGLAVQGKVLSVLEERIFERVGGGQPIKADVRIVAATNRELRVMAQQGAFRQDLYYRLDVFPIELPPLRERASDIPLLVGHLLEHIAQRLSMTAPQVPDSVLDLLSAQPWPGNVRQLANLLERGIILNENGVLTEDTVMPFLDSAPSTVAPSTIAPSTTAPSTTAAPPWPPSSGATPQGSGEDDEARVRRALLEADGDKHRAATALGCSYSTLQRRVKRYDLEGFPKYRS